MSRQPAAPAATASPRAAQPGRSYVVNRRGERVQVRFDEITRRNEELCANPEYGPPLAAIDAPLVTAQVIARFRSGITTRELDALTVQVCTGLAMRSLDYSRLAARICVSDLHKRVPACIRETVEALAAAAPDAASVRYSAEYRGILARRAAAVNARLAHARDYAFTFFGFQTLVRSYLFRAGERVEESSLHHDTLTERPGHLYMRVAIELFCGQADGRGHEAPDAVLDARLGRAFAYYDLLSRFRVSNATPTMLNAGTHHRQLSSCFQKAPGDDLRSLGETLTEAMLTSKWSGGVSFRLSGVRPEGAPIRSTGGKSSGKKRYIKLLEDVQLYANQGGNRPGAFAVYLEPWDDDVFTFLEMGRHKGVVLGAPDLKYGLWIPDAFVRALEDDLAGGAGWWHLFDSAAAPGLHRVWGAEFDALYARYVAEGRFRRRVRAREILTEAVITMGQSGTPYLLLKDNANAHSALRHVATITSSNICVAPDTLVLTDRGHRRIADVAGERVAVWNGAEWSDVDVVQTSPDAELVRVMLDNGAELVCTPEHKFYDMRGTEIRAGLLEPGTALEVAPAWPVIREGGDPFPHAYTHGLYCASTEPRDSPWAITLRGARQAAVHDARFEPHPIDPYLCESLDRLSTQVRLPATLPPRAEMPWASTLDARLRWLEGYFDGTGGILRDGRGVVTARFGPADKGTLGRVRLLLQTLGCDARVHDQPRDAADYTRGPYGPYCLDVACRDLWALIDLGFRPAQLSTADLARAPHSVLPPVRVERVERRESRSATYCFTEPRRHRGVFNGVLTGQCTETTLLCWSDFEAADFGADAGETGVCNLGAIPLASFVLDEPRDPAEHGLVGAYIDVEGLMEAAEWLTEALDNVITLNFYPDELSRRGSTRHRPIGIGVMGLADVLLRLKLAYGSEEAEVVDRALHAAIYYATMRATARLARERGAFPSLRDQRTRWSSPLAEGRLQPDLWVETGHLAPGWEAEIERALGRHLPAAAWEAQRAELREGGARNCYTTASMPTATTSNIVGQNECFEPYTSNVYTRRVLAGEMTVVNHHLVAELTELGLWTEEIRLAIIGARGSVQGIEAIPEDIRRRFRTARELDSRLVVLASIARGPFIGQSQSLNHYCDVITVEDVLTNLILAQKGGLTTAGYYRHMTPASGGTKAAVAVAGRGMHYLSRAEMGSAAPHAFGATDPEPERGGCTSGACTL